MILNLDKYIYTRINLNIKDADVRRIVREEMARASPPSASPTNVYRRTQNLIRSCVKSESNPQPTLIAAPIVSQRTPLSAV